MVAWTITLVAFLLSILWGVMFLRQLKSGLTETDLDDKFTWGLYIQGFFFFSALAGGMLIVIAFARLFEVAQFHVIIRTSAAVSFSCLAAAGILLSSDLGRPFRSLKIITGKNFASPMSWDFYMLSICGILLLLFLLGLIPESGAGAALWSILGLIAGLGFVMIHTLFFLSRVGAGFRSQPFLGLDTLSQSLWGGMALINLIALFAEVRIPFMAKILAALTVLVVIPLVGAHIAYLSNKRKGFDQKNILLFDTAILVVLLAVIVFRPLDTIVTAICSILILLAVFLEKSHLLRQYQRAPNLPLPYSRYDEVPDYSPTASEWLTVAGSLGICVFLSSVIIYFS